MSEVTGLVIYGLGEVCLRFEVAAVLQGSLGMPVKSEECFYLLNL
jgi:hypothetical protein